MAQKILLKKSNVVDKLPTSAEFGELFVNYASGTGKSFLSTKKNDGSIATFHEDAYFGDLSGSVVTLSGSVINNYYDKDTIDDRDDMTFYHQRCDDMAQAVSQAIVNQFG